MVDAGPLIAAMITSDTHHAVCKAWLAKASIPLKVPALVIAEICYQVSATMGPQAEVKFLRMVADGIIEVVETKEDWPRICEIAEAYVDLPLGGADASVVAAAERLGITRVATIDHTHFRVVIPKHTSAFELVPTEWELLSVKH